MRGIGGREGGSEMREGEEGGREGREGGERRGGESGIESNQLLIKKTANGH